jgi:hypothetical protein
VAAVVGIRGGGGVRPAGGAAGSADRLGAGGDPAVRGVCLDPAGECERGLGLGPYPDAGADLLGEHLVARDVVLGERVELGLTGVPAATANRKKAP